MMPLFRFLLFWAQPIICILLGLYVGFRSNEWHTVWSWFWKSTLTYLIGLFFTVSGLIMVAIGIPFRVEYLETTKQFTDARYAHLGNWVLTRLPAWLRPWDNAFDGLMGDKRGWFANWCVENSINYPSFLAFYVWAAIRNPANFWSRNITGCNVVGCAVKVLFGPPVVDEKNPGLHLIVAHCQNGKSYPLISFCFPWRFKPTKAVFGKFGWKVKLSHAKTPADAKPQDQIKGSVYRCSLWKSI